VINISCKLEGGNRAGSDGIEIIFQIIFEQLIIKKNTSKMAERENQNN
jgi:hypothetical protein